MITIRITGDGGRKALARIAQRLSHPAPVMRVIAGLLEDRTAENFATQSGPLGRWPAIKPPKNKARTNPQILRDTGRLSASITSRAGNNTAEIGTNVVYAAIHQFGGDINMPARSQQSYFKQAKNGTIGRLFVRKAASNFAQWHTRGAHTITIPARPFLPFIDGHLQDGLEPDILSELSRFLLNRAP